MVTAIRSGETQVTATTVDGGFTATAQITVLPLEVLVSGITLDQTIVELFEDETLLLNATVEPSNATIDDVVWSSSAPEIATIDQSGLVTAINAGEAVISVTTLEGGFTASSIVRVLQRDTANQFYELNEIRIFPNPTEAFLNIGLPNFDFDENPMKHIRIFDATGKLVLSITEFEANEFSNVFQFDFSVLRPGRYIVELAYRNGDVEIKGVLKR